MSECPFSPPIFPLNLKASKIVFAMSARAAGPPEDVSVNHRQFRIRDLFWLTLVAAVALAWHIDHRKTSAIRAELDSCTARLSSSQAECFRLTGEIINAHRALARQSGIDAQRQIELGRLRRENEWWHEYFEPYPHFNDGSEPLYLGRE